MKLLTLVFILVFSVGAWGLGSEEMSRFANSIGASSKNSRPLFGAAIVGEKWHNSYQASAGNKDRAIGGRLNIRGPAMNLAAIDTGVDKRPTRRPLGVAVELDQIASKADAAKIAKEKQDVAKDLAKFESPNSIYAAPTADTIHSRPEELVQAAAAGSDESKSCPSGECEKDADIRNIDIN